MMDRDRGRKLQFYKDLPGPAYHPSLCRSDVGRTLFPGRERMGAEGSADTGAHARSGISENRQRICDE